MGLLNYTTKIDADKTAAEIAKCLSSHGVQAIMTEYEPSENYVSALSFAIVMNGQKLTFRLPCDWHPVLAIITKGKKKPSSWDKQRFARWESDWRDQAVRVSWRIIKDWVEAQMALVETQMVTTAQVFLPYAVMPDDRILFEHVAQNPQFLLGDGSSPPHPNQ
jgi:hypothetical protein